MNEAPEIMLGGLAPEPPTFPSSDHQQERCREYGTGSGYRGDLPVLATDRNRRHGWSTACGGSRCRVLHHQCSTSVLSLMNSGPAYENPVDMNGDKNSYTVVTVTATDPGPA